MSDERTAGPMQGWIATMACWLAVMGSVLIAPLLPFMQVEFSRYPNVQMLVTLALAIPALTVAIVSPLVGRVIDSAGRKPVFIVALLIYVVAGTAPVWLDSLYSIIGSRVIVGLSEAALTTVAAVLTTDYFHGRERERWLSLQTASASLVATAMFALGGFLGTLALGWRTPFLVYGAMILLLPLIVKFIWEPVAATDSANAARPAGKPEPRKGVPWKLVGHVCAMSLFASVCFYVVPIQISFLLHDRGLADPGSIGMASAIASLGVPAGAAVFQCLARQPIARLLSTSLVLFCAGFGMIALIDDTTVTVIGGFVACFGGGIALPLLLVWTVSRLPFEQRGSGAGAFTGAFFLGQFFSPVLVAALSNALHGLPAAVGFLSALCGAMALVSLLVCLTRPGRESRLAEVGAVSPH